MGGEFSGVAGAGGGRRRRREGGLRSRAELRNGGSGLGAWTSVRKRASLAPRGRGPCRTRQGGTIRALLAWARGVVLLARPENNGFPARGAGTLLARAPCAWAAGGRKEKKPLPPKGVAGNARTGGATAAEVRAAPAARQLASPTLGKGGAGVRSAAFAARWQRGSDFPAGARLSREGAAVGPPARAAAPPTDERVAGLETCRAREGRGRERERGVGGWGRGGRRGNGGNTAPLREPVTGGAAPAGASPAAVTCRGEGGGAGGSALARPRRPAGVRAGARARGCLVPAGRCVRRLDCGVRGRGREAGSWEGPKSGSRERLTRE